MKTYRLQWILALMASASAYAKPPQEGGDRRPPPVPPWFVMLDTNRDKTLSEDEIKAAADVIAKLDKNHDGEITLDEFRMPPPAPGNENGPKGPPPGGKRPLPPVIAALDADHDGTISAKEMEDAPEALKTLDKNGDGELSPDELRPPGPPPREEGNDQGAPPPSEDSPIE